MRTIIVTRSGQHQPIKYVPFNPGSRQHIIKWMEEDYGYTFPFYTPKGSPKADVDSMNNMDHEAGKLLVRYLKASKDQSGRFTSSAINLAQIPAQPEFRKLFNAPTYYQVDGMLYSKLQEAITSNSPESSRG